ncbi:MAG: BamA/TamA family outer membrane protein [Candidatus Eremiobacteraeota bacterium]|nr:BamA/TamA family outer membrane protein [Candidatus Eremiobacteraeota bacterium]
MILSCFRRARYALARCAGFALALTCIATFVVPPAISAPAAPNVVAVSVSGNVHVASDRILSVAKLRPGMPYDPAVVEQDVKSIFALGFFSDQVPPLIRQRPGGVAVTYRVIENPIIKRVTFNGNAHVPADTLLALMDTAVGQVLNTNTFHQDVLKINSYYDRIGYGGQVPTHVKDLNIDPPTGVLNIAIQEGLTVNQVIIGGDPVLPPNLILPALTVKQGAPFSEEARDKDIEAVKKLYDKYDLSLGDFEGGIDPTTVNLKAGTANVKYNISAAKVGAVQITGNTKTKDVVIRRELRLRPGMYITQGALRRDYERLNNTGFFSKVELTPKPGPDPKNPALVTLNWKVTEQRTGTAQIGAGYSGGITGQGLTGTLSYSENNINGTGNGGSVRFERGARSYDVQASSNIPYVGKTKNSQKYSFGATIFANGQTNYYPVYSTSSTAVASPAPGASSAPIPVTLYPNSTQTSVTGVLSTSTAKSSGVSLNLGRRLTDFVRASAGVNVQRVSTSTTVPTPYFFAQGQPNVLVGPTPTPGFGTTNPTGSFGINAPSIANINTGTPFKLYSVVLGLANDTRDDVFNPRRGVNNSISTEVSSPSFGSDFRYTRSDLNVIKFFPAGKTATLGVHGRVGVTSGAIPPNSLFTFSDQELRGYQNVFYGTDIRLGQVELRYPVTADRKLTIAAFLDEGGYRIRGAKPLLDPYTNRIIGFPGDWAYRGDVGVGLRFDVPQLGLRTIRIDYARGSNGAHTSFGIGQSF